MTSTISDVVTSDPWLLQLFIAEMSPRSLRAVTNMQRICAQELEGRYRLEVVDLYKQPHLAQGEQIIALPALIKKAPPPLRMVIGDMSDTRRVLLGLNLMPE
jgi:circadian clock protein KaiB